MDDGRTWKELMVEEKEHMMMSKKDMDEDQLMWWKEYKEDITERKRIFRGASSTLRGDTPMSGGGYGGVEDSITGDNGVSFSRNMLDGANLHSLMSRQKDKHTRLKSAGEEQAEVERQNVREIALFTKEET
ncbi:putative methionyl-tRNA synthetase [Hordeum vulgare]|nr:putative methionyl-tRNA synthetase [Hordeum vulgare]